MVVRFGGRPILGRRLTVATPRFAGSVHVREDGPADAPALVLLHGFSGSMHWFGPVVPLLADAFRVIRIDLLGHADTGGPAADAPIQAEVVDAVLDRLGVAAATAVGHSFGADVAVELAERSERIERLVIVAQAPDYSDATFPRGSVLMGVPVLSGLLGRLFQVLAAGAGAAAALRRGDRVGRELAALELRDFRALRVAMFRVVLVDRRRRMARCPLDAQVQAAGKPTLVVLGGLDHFYGARSAPRYRAAGADVEIIDEADHSPLIDQPERSAGLIRAFAAGDQRVSSSRCSNASA